MTLGLELAIDNDAEAVGDDTTAVFHIEEYRTLRAEISRWSADIRFLERAGVVGPVLLYSWLFTNDATVSKDPALLALWVTPIVCAIFMWVRIARIKRMIQQIAAYMITLEQAFRRPPIVGWEHHLQDFRGYRSEEGIGITEHAFWAILTAIYFLIAGSRIWPAVAVWMERAIVP